MKMSEIVKRLDEYLLTLQQEGNNDYTLTDDSTYSMRFRANTMTTSNEQTFNASDNSRTFNKDKDYVRQNTAENYSNMPSKDYSALYNREKDYANMPSEDYNNL